MPQVCYTRRADQKDTSFNVDTYAKVKKYMRGYLEMSTGEVKVFRKRKGEWGEWIESWSLVGDKLEKRDIGWQ